MQTAQQVEVDLRVDIPLVEISGLAWDAQSRQLYAVSDHGYLYVFRVGPAESGLWRITPVSMVRIQAMDGASVRPDAEGMAIRRGPSDEVELLVASEREQRLWRVNTSGRVLGEEALPVTLPGSMVVHGKNKGMEAVAWTADRELVLAFEGPADTGLHTAFGPKRVWRWRTIHGAKTRVKDMAFGPDGSLYWLEREDSRTFGTRVHVRSLNPAQCPEQDVCAVKEIGFLPRFGGGGNFEGLTYLGDNVWMAVSDEGQKAGRGAVFVVFRPL